MIRRPPRSTLFPYTTALPIYLVAAAGIPEAFLTGFVNLIVEGGLEQEATVLVHAGTSGVGLAAIQVAKVSGARVARSEEHTSELQSQSNIVCRLLLEKKKKHT